MVKSVSFVGVLIQLANVTFTIMCCRDVKSLTDLTLTYFFIIFAWKCST